MVHPEKPKRPNPLMASPVWLFGLLGASQDFRFTWLWVHGVCWVCHSHSSHVGRDPLSLLDVGAERLLKNSRSHIDASHSRQPLVKGERLVRYEVNAVMGLQSDCSNVKVNAVFRRARDTGISKSLTNYTASTRLEVLLRMGKERVRRGRNYHGGSTATQVHRAQDGRWWRMGPGGSMMKNRKREQKARGGGAQSWSPEAPQKLMKSH